MKAIVQKSILRFTNKAVRDNFFMWKQFFLHNFNLQHITKNINDLRFVFISILLTWILKLDKWKKNVKMFLKFFLLMQFCIFLSFSSYWLAWLGPRCTTPVSAWSPCWWRPSPRPRPSSGRAGQAGRGPASASGGPSLPSAAAPPFY